MGDGEVGARGGSGGCLNRDLGGFGRLNVIAGEPALGCLIVRGRGEIDGLGDGEGLLAEGFGVSEGCH